MEGINKIPVIADNEKEENWTGGNIIFVYGRTQQNKQLKPQYTCYIHWILHIEPRSVFEEWLWWLLDPLPMKTLEPEVHDQISNVWLLYTYIYFHIYFNLILEHMLFLQKRKFLRPQAFVWLGFYTFIGCDYWALADHSEKRNRLGVVFVCCICCICFTSSIV